MALEETYGRDFRDAPIEQVFSVHRQIRVIIDISETFKATDAIYTQIEGYISNECRPLGNKDVNRRQLAERLGELGGQFANDVQRLGLSGSSFRMRWNYPAILCPSCKIQPWNRSVYWGQSFYHSLL
jgi:hypothetical protein